MEPLLKIENLTVDFITESGTHRALDAVSFALHAGEVVALVGESGSGKSVTSLSILQLLPKPPALYVDGRILFSPAGQEPVDLLKLPEKQVQRLRGSQIAMIFQEPMTSLNPVMTCGKQVLEALMLHQTLREADARKEVIHWFEKVRLPDPESVFQKYPHQLSGGQKQRVMIAMAMCCEPAVLICDEPTTALDVTVQKTILDLLKELQQQTGMGIIFITHDLGVVAEIADRTVVMYKGRQVETNTVTAIFQQPLHPYTKGLLACRPILHQKGTRLPIVADFLHEATPNRSQPPSLPSVQSEKTPSAPSVLMEVRDLSVEFITKRNWLGKPLSRFRAVDGVNFSVMSGETLGLVGESGCGKTTLGRALLRLIEPTGGDIVYMNSPLLQKSKKEMRRLRKSLQMVFQDPFSSLNPRIPIGQAIAEPMKVHGIATTYQMRKEKTIELLEKVGLDASHYNRYPHEFSGGQRQRIVIARALALNPSFIVCDESVSALDVSVQAQVLNLLNDLKAEYGFTIIFISHDLSVVRYISDRILVMQKGKIVESGAAEDIYLRPQSPYTQQLIAAIPGKSASA